MKNNKLKLLIIVLVMFSFTFLLKIDKTKAIYRESKSTTLNLSVISSGTNYTVTFNSAGGSSVPSRTIQPNQAVGTLEIPTKAGENFLGWFDSNNNRIDYTEVITGNVTFTAHWGPVVCKKVTDETKLHTETCVSGGCKVSGTGFNTNDTITYGQVSTSLLAAAGDAYECDVNYDGTYDAIDAYNRYTERFYFIRTKTNSGSDDTAVLFYSTSFDSNGRVTHTANKTDVGSTDYTTALTWLPTSTTPSGDPWDNPYLIDFNNDGTVTRFLTFDDIGTICGTPVVTNQSSYFTACQPWYLFDLSRFQSANLGRAGIWLQPYNNTYYRLHSQSLYINTGDEGINSANMARPAIEIPMNKLEGYIDEDIFTISFNLHDDNNNPVDPIDSVERYRGQKVGTLPTPTRTHYAFVNWYTDSGYTNLADPNALVDSNITLHAKWNALPTTTVTFNLNGGTGVPSSGTYDVGVPMDPWPTPTYTGRQFMGWYTDSGFNTQFTQSDPVTADLELFAKWIELNSVAEVNNVGYPTLQDAIDAVPTTGVKTRVTLLANISMSSAIEIPSNKWVELDGGSYAITGSIATFFTNKGKLDIISGSLTTTGTNIIANNGTNSVTNISGGTLTSNATDSKNVIEINSGTVNITGGSIICNATGAAINNRTAGGRLNVSGGIIKGTNTEKGQAIYIEKSSTTTISGTAYIENVSMSTGDNARAAVDNNGGTLTITGGTIISKQHDAVSNRASGSTTTIGNDNGTIDITTPVLRGKIYGLEKTNGTVNVYDGIFESLDNSSAISTTNVNKPNGAIFKTDGTTVIDGVTYNTAYLLPPTLTVRFFPENGDSTISKTINSGSAIGTDMPTDPTKSGYYFDGWYDGNTEITSATVVTSAIDAYARWVQSFTNGTITPSSLTMSIEVGDTGNISISGTGLESVSYSSSNSTIASVDANGEVTGEAVGTAYITITGDKSGATRTVEVTVTQVHHTVTIDLNDGTTTPTQVQVAHGNAIGSDLPSNATRTNYVLVGWYVSGDTSTPAVTTATQITTDVTIKAVWHESVTIATISPNSLTLTVGGSTGTITVTASVQNDILESYTCSSSDTNVATVSNCVVTPVAQGTATITVTGTESNQSSATTVSVTVNAAVVNHTVTIDLNDGTTTPTQVQVAHGNAIGSDLPSNATRTNYVLVGWYVSGDTSTPAVTTATQITTDVTIKAVWHESVTIATISPNSLTLTAGGSTGTITVTASVQNDILESYTCSSSDTNVATVSNCVVTPVAQGTATITITGTESNQSSATTVSVTVNAASNSHTVHFLLDENAVSDYDTMTINHDAILGSLPTTPTISDYVFSGWYTEPDPDGTKINEETHITGDVTFYAHWDKLVCKKATALHSSSGTNIGTLPGNNTPAGGFAYDCDVNGNDVIDTLNSSGVNSDSLERFYYLTTDSDDYAALMFWNNTHQDNGLQYICGADGLIYSSTPTSGPDGSELPTTTDWPNVSLHSVPRQLYNENGTTAFGSNGTLLTASYSGKAARFATTQEIEAATGVALANMQSDGAMIDYKYLFENLKVLPTLGNSSCRSNYWLETPKASGSAEWRVSGDTSHYKLASVNGGTTSKSATRPVIEVSTRLIEGFPIMYSVTFNSMQGSAVAVRSVADGEQLGTLPTAPTRSGYIFGGWYTTTNYNTQVTSTRVIHDDVEFFAKWIPDINQATVSPLSIILSVNGTSQITITPVTDMESYTIASSNTSVATFDSSTNTVTGVAVGEANIVITGTTSNISRNIPVTVSSSSNAHTVTFIQDNGQPQIEIQVEDGQEIGSDMPNDPTKTNYDFDAWFLLDSNDDMTNTRVDSTRVITQDEKYKASYYGSTIIAAINHTYYTNVNTAINAATDDVETEVRILRDITNPTQIVVPSTKNIILNGGNNTISVTSDGGTSGRLMYNEGTLRVVSGTYTCAKDKLATMQNGPTGHMYIEGGIITNTNNRSAIYNEGTLTISGGELSSTSKIRGVIHTATDNASVTMTGGTVTQTETGDVTASGTDDGRGAIRVANGKRVTVTITGGTIISNSTNSCGVYIPSTATLTIGTLDSTNHTYDATSPIIQAKNYAVISDANYSIYDGKLKSLTQNTVVNDQSKITGTEDNAQKQVDTENGYNVLYYTVSSQQPTHRINLELYGGINSQAPNYRDFDCGDTIASASELPTPTKGIYTFGGWYLDSNASTQPVQYPYQIPSTTGSTTFYAKWTYTSSNTPVNHNILGTAMQSYFSNVSTWVTTDLTDPSNEDPTEVPPQNASDANNYDNGHSLFKSSISNVFTTNSCSLCQASSNSNTPANNDCNNPSSGTYCDQPGGYDTGMTGTVNVYLYENGQKTNTLASYVTQENGVLYNMIPGVSYYWELASDANVYGIVTAQSGTRRTLKVSGVRNVRDLGGMSVTYTNSLNQTVTGTIDYGRLYRGAQITSAQGVTDLETLGVTREIDLRPDSEGGGNSNSSIRMTNFDIGTKNSHTDLSMTNYIVNPVATYYITSAHESNYRNVKKVLREVMKYIVNDGVNPGDNIYFHCTIGTDRTGTLAYFLEGLLGVSEEDRLRDYEMTYFFGLTNRTRFHDSVSWSSSANPRFYSMYRSYPTNADIYNYYKAIDIRTDSSEISDDDLLDAFRDVMIVNKVTS